MTTDELKAAADRIARINSGERQRVVYGFGDENMDDFMHRMLENRYVSDLKILAAAYLGTRSASRALRRSRRRSRATESLRRSCKSCAQWSVPAALSRREHP